MGIPAFFSYIIKNHSAILTNLKHTNVRFASLYMDCNSIVYDAYYSLLKTDTPQSSVDRQTQIVDIVIQTIEMYIAMIQPSKLVYIAFDGVAPFAKMEQQRTRRYKTDFLASLTATFPGNTNNGNFLTSMITPGTHFMEFLTKRITAHFANPRKQQVIVSSSNEAGEGEHKMFQYMRDHPHIDDIVAVYGLDSDLIMLSLFHFELFNNIFIFREAPEFMKSSIPIIVSNEKNKNEPYFINTKLLSISIVDEMDCKYKKKSQIYDYIFLCFFLGNDFLPHFPAINIRTTGIQFLLDTYRKYIGRFPNRTLVSHATKQIEWKWVSVLVHEMAKNERYLILDDFVSREKYNHWKWKETTEKEKEEKINSLPVIYRTVENYIYPKEPYWEERYYMALFPHPPQVKRHCEPQMQQICNNYMEGLEWVYRYYTVGCPDWRWKYKYHYPPLLCDLQKYIPHFQMNFINGKYPDNRPFSPHVQLAYVLPKTQMMVLMPYGKQREYLLKQHGDLYPDTFDFMWAFKRYLYESSCILPEISMEVLQQWEKELVVV